MKDEEGCLYKKTEEKKGKVLASSVFYLKREQDCSEMEFIVKLVIS